MQSVDRHPQSPADCEELGPRIWRRLRDLALSVIVVGVCAMGAALRPANAAQSLEVREGDTTVVRISIRDQTRLRADRGRLLDVIGDVYDAQKNPGGRIVVLKDQGDGEFYLKPVAPTYQGPNGQLVQGLPAPIKLDVKTDRGTVGLLLQPADVVGDTLSLRVTGGEGRAAANESAFRAKAGAHVRGIKALTLAMAAPDLGGELQALRLPAGGEVLSLWQEARFVLKTRHQAAGLVGETYELTNVSRELMVIDERELYRPGVLSVGVRLLSLAPGETTAVWIVRLAGDQD